MSDEAATREEEGPDRARRRWHAVGRRPVRVSIMTRGLLGGLLAALVGLGILLGPQDAGRPAKPRAAVRLIGNGTLVSSLGFSPDGQTLAAGYTGGELRLWDMGTQGSRAVQPTLAVVSSVMFAPDGRSLALADHGEAIYRFDCATLRPLPPLRSPDDKFATVCFSHDGRTLAAGDVDGRITLWNIAQGRIRAVLRGHRGMIGVLAFSHDDRTLASGGGIDGTIRLWDSAQARPVRVLAGHPSVLDRASMDRVMALDFSPDDRMLVSGGGFDPYVRLWDVRSGDALAAWLLDPSACRVSFAAFTTPRTIPQKLENTSHARLRQWPTGGGTTVLAGYGSRSRPLAMAPDGPNLAIGNWSDILVWKLERASLHSRAGRSQP